MANRNIQWSIKRRGLLRGWPLAKTAGGRGHRAILASLLLVSVGALIAGAASGHVIKPHFGLPWERIRYHDTFHDGHGHDGYGHGFHMGNSGHIHDEHGMAVRPPWPPAIIGYQLGPSDMPLPSIPGHPYGDEPLQPEIPPGPLDAVVDVEVTVVNEIDLSGVPSLEDLAAMGPADVAQGVLGNTPGP